MTATLNDDRLVLVDIETTGLEAITEQILEVGFRIIDKETFDRIDEFEIRVWDSPTYDRKLESMIRSTDPNIEYVVKMHQANGLWDACREDGFTLDEAEAEIVMWLGGHGITSDVPIKERPPLVGSSVHFDRTFVSEQMTDVNDCFHYRNIDVSSVKELCRRYNPDLYSKLPKGRDTHRSLPDLEDTTDELKFYVDNFLFIPA